MSSGDCGFIAELLIIHAHKAHGLAVVCWVSVMIRMRHESDADHTHPSLADAGTLIVLKCCKPAL
jgi:hypothetical protein